MKFDERLDRISELIAERTRVNAELANLVGAAPEAKALPDGVSLEDEVKKVFANSGESYRVADLKKIVDEKYDVNLPRSKVQTAVTALSKAGELEKGERGVYKTSEIPFN